MLLAGFKLAYLPLIADCDCQRTDWLFKLMWLPTDWLTVAEFDLLFKYAAHRLADRIAVLSC